LLPPELSGETSQKVNLILNRFLNQFPRDRDEFAFHLLPLVILAGISQELLVFFVFFHCSGMTLGADFLRK
jgi:hypothetical protein